MDIRQDSADLKFLKDEFVRVSKQGGRDYEALEQRVAKLEARLGL